MDPWPLFGYTQYIQSLSMFIRTFSFLAFIVPKKSVKKSFKNDKIWKPMKGHISKSYGLLANILSLDFPYLRDQMWYKFHRDRTTNIKVIEQNAFQFFENLPRDITKSYGPLVPIRIYSIHQSLSMCIGIFSFLAFIVPELQKFSRMAKFKNQSSNITPRVMGLWPPFYHYTFLTFETKCGLRFIEVGPQT